MGATNTYEMLKAQKLLQQKRNIKTYILYQPSAEIRTYITFR